MSGTTSGGTPTPYSDGAAVNVRILGSVGVADCVVVVVASDVFVSSAADVAVFLGSSEVSVAVAPRMPVSVARFGRSVNCALVVAASARRRDMKRRERYGRCVRAIVVGGGRIKHS